MKEQVIILRPYDQFDEQIILHSGYQSLTHTLIRVAILQWLMDLTIPAEDWAKFPKILNGIQHYRQGKVGLLIMADNILLDDLRACVFYFYNHCEDVYLPEVTVWEEDGSGKSSHMMKLAQKIEFNDYKERK